MDIQQHLSALRAQRIAVHSFSPGRDEQDGYQFRIFTEDWTAEDLTCTASLYPGGDVVATLTVSMTAESKTGVQLRDEECVHNIEEYLPCDAVITDTFNNTILTVSWSTSTFSSVAAAEVLGGTVRLYYEIRRTNGTGPIFMAGQLILRE